MVFYPVKYGIQTIKYTHKTHTWISAMANSEIPGVTNCKDFLAASIFPENTSHLSHP